MNPLKAVLVLLAAALPYVAGAQDNASQAITANVGEIIGISFLNGGAAPGSSVGEAPTLHFSNVDELTSAGASTADMPEWTGYRILVQSTTGFKVTMKSTSTTFTPSDGADAGVVIQGKLRLKLSDPTFSQSLFPNTGGYKLSTGGLIKPTEVTIVNNGPWGGNNQFSVTYIAPHWGWGYHAGTYTAEIQYTATNL